jgi:hypothetical protein
MSIEMAGVQATLAAATLCVAFVNLVETLGKEGQGESALRLRAGAEQLRPGAESHVAWATGQMTTMVKTLAKHPTAHKVGQVAEKVVGKVKDALS